MEPNRGETTSPAHVDLFWLPLGAGAGGGARCVRGGGRLFEAVMAGHQHRESRDLYHSALQVQLDGGRFVIEMAPVWSLGVPDRGVVVQGPVGMPWLGRSRLFRYEVRRWRNGVIPDVADAVDSPRRLSEGAVQARQLLDLVPAFPAATWGRDELNTGDMWNSNSLISWLLARSGHRMEAIAPPAHGRAPGWAAGLAIAARQQATAAAAQPVADSIRTATEHHRLP